MKRPRLTIVAILILSQMAISACSLKMSRYSDGPLTEYLTQPIPKLDKPLARTLSLEVVDYQTAANMKGIMISDLVAREIYILPATVGSEVDTILQMDAEFSEKATLDALNVIAKNRSKARNISGSGSPQPMPDTIGTSSQYVKNQERLAQEAYRNGDYLKGNIHNSAAMNSLMIDQSFAQAQSTVNLGFAILGAAQAAGEALIKKDFNNMRHWIAFESGAIGPEAPEDTHLSVFFLQYFDAKSFQLDSRMRVAVLLVLLKNQERSALVLEGSDILFCEDECNLFQPKPTAKLIVKEALSGDVRSAMWTNEGLTNLNANGFDNVSGIYQYILLQHGLKKLSQR